MLPLNTGYLCVTCVSHRLLYKIIHAIRVSLINCIITSPETGLHFSPPWPCASGKPVLSGHANTGAVKISNTSLQPSGETATKHHLTTACLSTEFISKHTTFPWLRNDLANTIYYLMDLSLKAHVIVHNKI